MSHELLQKIKIRKTPEGSAPKEIRDEWVGIEMLGFKLPKGVEELDFTTGQEFGNRGGFMVQVEPAIRKLEYKSPVAARWFRDHLPLDMECLTFGPNEVEILQDASISKDDL